MMDQQTNRDVGAHPLDEADSKESVDSAAAADMPPGYRPYSGGSPFSDSASDGEDRLEGEVIDQTKHQFPPNIDADLIEGENADQRSTLEDEYRRG